MCNWLKTMLEHVHASPELKCCLHHCRVVSRSISMSGQCLRLKIKVVLNCHTKPSRIQRMNQMVVAQGIESEIGAGPWATQRSPAQAHKPPSHGRKAYLAIQWNRHFLWINKLFSKTWGWDGVLAWKKGCAWPLGSSNTVAPLFQPPYPGCSLAAQNRCWMAALPPLGRGPHRRHRRLGKVRRLSHEQCCDLDDNLLPTGW